MLGTALLVLTLGAGGDVRMALAPSASAEACEAQRQQVDQILRAAGQQVIAVRCGQTALQLTPFRHGTTEQEQRYRWRVRLPASGGYVLEALKPGSKACRAATQAEPAVFCARSAQALRPR